MKRILLVLMVAISVLACSFAGDSSLSVPLSSDAYRIIDTAVIRGIIDEGSQVRPYSVSLVRSLMEQILASGKISDSEKQTIGNLLAGFVQTYGPASSSFGEALATTGNLSLFATDYANAKIGARFSTYESVTKGAVDSRNKLTAYISGDVLDKISFFMDLSLLVDKVNHNAFLYTDFTTECEGWYSLIMKGGARVETSPFDGIADGLAMAPEVSASLLDNALTIRFGAIKRDWGPGLNNLALSGSARTFDGLEFTYNPNRAFSFSFLVGSLGKGFLKLNGESQPAGMTGIHNDDYDNNLTLQRIEISPVKGLKLSIYESVIWRKRFEVAYLNPLSVLMFAQNYIGDFDNMMAGFDMSYTFEGLGKVYFGLSIDEMSGPKKLFTFARNIIALQGGINIALPVFDFSELTLQATYIPPFFGTHFMFAKENNPFGSGNMAIDYVNKGQSLSYPLYPDSLELLASFKTTLPADVSLNVTVKDQMRSAQYSIEEGVGTGYDVWFIYKNMGSYVDKDFFSYIWRNTLDVRVDASKSLKSLPVTLTAGIEVIADSKRPYTISSVDTDIPELSVPHDFNYGTSTVMGSGWTTEIKPIVHFGVSVYY